MSKQQIRIHALPADHAALLRALRLIGNTGLGQVSSLASYLQTVHDPVVAAGLDEDVAGHIADALREAGADIAVEDCSINTPMLCFPPANEKFAWSLFRGVLPAK